MTHRPRDERGFTLIEVMLVCSLFLIVMGATLTAFTAFTTSNRRGEKQVDQAETARVGLDIAARQLRNLANPTVPRSMSLPHEGADSNYDSVGLFQQRPSQGWGIVEQLMNAGESSRLFYSRLVKVSGWETMSIGGAAQAVQRSAFPGAYDKHQALAQQIVAALA